MELLLPVRDRARPAIADGIIEDLNEPQREAVLHSHGPMLVLAGAGSGKTRALTRKIAWLVQIDRLAPWEILAVTFTNKAAGEMRERCHALLGDRANDLWLGTFHSIGVRLLRQHGARIGIQRNFVIYDDDDQETLIKRVLKQLNLSDKSYPVKAIRAYIDRAKQLCHGPDHPELMRSGHIDRVHAQVYEVYQARLKDANAVDFNDLIMLPWQLATRCEDIGFEWRSRWRYVLVDEFQDTNRAQYMLLKALLNREQNLCAVGDDDQSIYGWRGAEVEHILGFPREFAGAKVIRFEQNYRSTAPILALSTALISQNRERHGKVLWTERQGGEPIRVYAAQTERDEAEWVVRRIGDLRGRYNLSEMAVFYRTNAQSRSFEDVLRRNRIPYRVFGGLRFYDRAEIKDIIAYLRFIHNPRDGISLERIINRPTRGIGKVTLERMQTRAEQGGETLWEALCAEARNLPKLAAFVAMVVELQQAARDRSAFELVTRLLELTEYLQFLSADGTVEGETRAENVRELVSAISEYAARAEDPGIGGFLEEVALISSLDTDDGPQDMVVLMTAHMAKGLEFDVVFVTGLEENILPHANSLDSERGLEEERRLAYVGMTRARHQLHLSHAGARMRFGQTQLMTPSRFLDGLPRELLRMEGVAGRGRGIAASGLAAMRADGGVAPRFGGASSFAAQKTAARPVDPTEVSDTVPDWENESQDGDDAALATGRRVFHPTFGEGRIEAVEGQGPKAKVTVRFRDGASRKLVATVLVMR
jgi:DNA helicase-2/ATP-dependent DNA helicase PcrA